MTLKKQWANVTNNWLLLALILVLLLAFSFLRVGSTAYSMMGSVAQGGYAADESYARNAMPVMDGISMPPYYGNDFAPEVAQRQITKSASLSTEVNRGEFTSADQRLRGMLASANALLLNENVNKNGEGLREYRSGWYQVKVPTANYDSLVTQLKTIGEVQSFNENADDITEQFESIETRLSTEQARLARFQEMYASATKVEDKIQLTDRIFELERTIKYLEESQQNLGNRVSYSTVSVSITEERSDFANIAVVTFGELARSIVGSFNSLVTLLVSVLPWALAALLGVFIYKKVRK